LKNGDFYGQMNYDETLILPFASWRVGALGNDNNNYFIGLLKGIKETSYIKPPKEK
jgi:hypothetical protein